MSNRLEIFLNILVPSTGPENGEKCMMRIDKTVRTIMDIEKWRAENWEI